jgi:hypothetical protein
MNSDAREGQAVLASYKTPAVLLIYTVKSGKIPDNDTGREPIIANLHVTRERTQNLWRFFPDDNNKW